PGESSVVPVDMPLFQWKGLTFNNKQVVFPTPSACINQFENVLRSYNLDIEANWRRLLPKQLAIGTNACLKLYLKDHEKASWEQVKKAIKEKYRVSDTTLKNRAVNKLLGIYMKSRETIDQFTDRFLILKQRSGIVDEHTLSHCYIKAMKKEVSKDVKLFISMSNNAKKHTLDYAIQKVKAKFETL
ncbi:hypothetical protein BDB01DRAFT_710785, partial [Pilobolus umbonatus]